MITSKSELQHYLIRDTKALGYGRKHPKLLGDEIWKFQRSLRKREYFVSLTRKQQLLCLVPFLCNKLYFHHISIKLGFSIPPGVFAEGLSIAHRGTIVINGNARVGKNCRIQECVNIGATNGSSDAPIIGNNVFIGTGAKIIGDITIADDVAIGANAVVVKSITEPGTTWAGVPARKISDKSSRANLPAGMFE